MKQVFPQVRPRRLGTRGNSRYCYAGLKKRLKLEEPDTMESTDDKNIQVCINYLLIRPPSWILLGLGI